MAEPFGIVSGAIGIAAAFSACVDCFEYIQTGRHFGRDFQTDLLSLSCARLRLTRWGESVDIYNDPKLGKANASASETQLAKDALVQIVGLFAKTEEISKKYKSAAKSGDHLSTFSSTEMDPTHQALQKKMKELAIKRQKGTSFLKLTTWAIYRKAELRHLIEDITLIIENIERLFPSPQTQIALAQQEVNELGNKESLKLVEDSAKGVDGLLRSAAQEVLTGHQYFNVVVEGKVHAGDAYSSGWKFGALGASHNYDGVEVKGTALLGNKYGGKDFWDD
jgi:hypothetical protein